MELHVGNTVECRRKFFACTCKKSEEWRATRFATLAVLTPVNVTKGPPKMDAETAARIDHMEGQCVALMSAVRALILCHPDPKRAYDTVARQLDTFAGTALHGSHSEDFLNGIALGEKGMFPSESELAQTPMRP
jgi:hypothetical protein